MRHTLNPALSTTQREELARGLRVRQEALQALLQAREQGRSAAEQALATREQDGDDALQLACGHEVEAALSDIEQRELTQLSQALLRVHEAGYGRCADCGTDIPFARLQVEPQALRCVACEAKHERSAAG